MRDIERSREKTETINFRCTPEEKELIYAEAKKRHLTVTQLLIGSALGVLLGEGVYRLTERKEED